MGVGVAAEAEFFNVWHRRYREGVEDVFQNGTAFGFIKSKFKETVRNGLVQGYFVALETGSPIAGANANMFVQHGSHADWTNAFFSAARYSVNIHLDVKTIYQGRGNNFQERLTSIGKQGQAANKAMIRKLGWDWFGDGSGILGLCELMGGPGLQVTLNTLRLFEQPIIGQVVDIALSAAPGTVLAQARTITGYNLANRTITLDGANFTATANHAVYLNTIKGGVATNQPSRNQSLFGLPTLIGAANPGNGIGNFGGVDRAAAGNEFWQGIETNAGNNPISEDILVETINNITTGGGNPTVGFTSKHYIRRINGFLSADKSLIIKPGEGQPGLQVYKGGWADTASINNVRIYADPGDRAHRAFDSTEPGAPLDRIYFLDLTTMLFLVEKMPGWFDSYGLEGMMVRMPDSEELQGLFSGYMQMVSNNSGKNGSLINISLA